MSILPVKYGCEHQQQSCSSPCNARHVASDNQRLLRPLSLMVALGSTKPSPLRIIWQNSL